MSFDLCLLILLIKYSSVSGGCNTKVTRHLRPSFTAVLAKTSSWYQNSYFSIFSSMCRHKFHFKSSKIWIL